ncbi:hypothetical protein [Paraburkholderia flava]|uniref:hypothetical protein n=1 Tax=Paraburkholderia flava TaxID=2547393 RepID=UPI00105E7571|nr:hypothetical protein [Paraburkholderia flava]
MNGIWDWISIFTNESFFVLMDLARNHGVELTALIYGGGWLAAIVARWLGRLVDAIRRNSGTHEAIDYRALIIRKQESNVPEDREPLHIHSPSSWWARLMIAIAIVIVSTG